MKHEYLNIRSSVAQQYMRDAEEWIKTTGGYFSGSMGYGKVAVAEYMANQDGYTLIPRGKS